jgi:hypothetical protein
MDKDKIVFYILLSLPLPLALIFLAIPPQFKEMLVIGCVLFSGFWLWCIMVAGDLSSDGSIVTTKWSREDQK